MTTEVRRIEMQNEADLNSAIINLCNAMSINDFKLASTFVFRTQLVLIFQK